MVNRINVPDYYSFSAFFDFSTPIRKLGITFKTGLNESWDRGISYINAAQNINNTFNHTFDLSIENRKKNKWDLVAGGSVQLSDARYSGNEAQNKTYLNLNYFGEINFTPNTRWNFSVKGDVTLYDAKSFTNSVDIPLLRADISYTFLKDNRGILKLEASDILDKNTGLERISELNYLVEKRSNSKYWSLCYAYL